VASDRHPVVEPPPEWQPVGLDQLEQQRGAVGEEPGQGRASPLNLHLAARETSKVRFVPMRPLIEVPFITLLSDIERRVANRIGE
jgi:hypothetical protein